MIKLFLQRWQLARFVSVGGLATLLHIALFVAAVELIKLSPVSASVVAFSGAFILSYILNRRWTFSSRGRHQVELPRFFLVALSGLLLNVLIIYVVVEVYSSPYLFGLALVVMLVPLLSYVLNKNWAFSDGA